MIALPSNDAIQSSKTSSTCYHCGESCEAREIVRLLSAEKTLDFCCEGCKMVYEILNDHHLGQFYEIEDKAGISLKGKKKHTICLLRSR